MYLFAQLDAKCPPSELRNVLSGTDLSPSVSGPVSGQTSHSQIIQVSAVKVTVVKLSISVLTVDIRTLRDLAYKS